MLRIISTRLSHTLQSNSIQKTLAFNFSSVPIFHPLFAAATSFPFPFRRRRRPTPHPDQCGGLSTHRLINNVLSYALSIFIPFKPFLTINTLWQISIALIYIFIAMFGVIFKKVNMSVMIYFHISQFCFHVYVSYITQPFRIMFIVPEVYIIFVIVLLIVSRYILTTPRRLSINFLVIFIKDMFVDIEICGQCAVPMNCRIG